MDAPVAQTESPLETGRLVNNLVRLGVVTQLQLGNAPRCRVRVDEEETSWLPWVSLRAGSEKGGTFWWPPEVGEQVLLLSPGGDLAQAVVLPGVFSDHMAPKGKHAGEMRMDWSESDFLSYRAGTITMQVLESSIKITADAIEMAAGGGYLKLDGQGLTVSPEVRVGAIKLTEHKHTGVVTGPMVSGEPVP